MPNLPKMSKKPDNQNAIDAVAFMAGIYYFRTLSTGADIDHFFLQRF